MQAVVVALGTKQLEVQQPLVVEQGMTLTLGLVDLEEL
jgi:hypothetical protein